jgi:hypothetical protein
MSRYILVAMLAATLIAGCSGNPASPGGPGPSGSGPNAAGATIAGTVNLTSSANKSVHAMSGAPAAGLVITVAGTSLSTTSNTAGYFQLQDVPTGKVRLTFQQGSVNASTEVPDVKAQELVELQVEVSGNTATVVSDARAASKVSLCHRTGNGSYHEITISTDAESAHRAHGDGKVGEAVPGDTTRTFDATCQVTGPSVRIRKLTNGDDANDAPGPKILVGAPVTWEYIVTNTGTVSLSSLQVTDDRGVSVTCPSTTVTVGQSMTCMGSGTATAGQYRNEGTVSARSPAGVLVTDKDLSHYFGEAPGTGTTEGPKVELCHRTGNGSYHLLSVSVSAEPAHRAHGDGKIGEAVPTQAGKVFGSNCSVQ